MCLWLWVEGPLTHDEHFPQKRIDIQDVCWDFHLPMSWWYCSISIYTIPIHSYQLRNVDLFTNQYCFNRIFNQLTDENNPCYLTPEFISQRNPKNANRMPFQFFQVNRMPSRASCRKRCRNGTSRRYQECTAAQGVSLWVHTRCFKPQKTMQASQSRGHWGLLDDTNPKACGSIPPLVIIPY